MKGYYQKSGVRRAIMDFAYSGNSSPLREGAFYSEDIDGIQRHSPEDELDSVLVLDSDGVFYKTLRAGATAFYLSYWRYSNPSKPTDPLGRDLVWTLKAEDGGLSEAKRATVLFLEALEKEGFSHPLVKYSGKLGFDVMIPLEDVQTNSPDDIEFISEVQHDLTQSASRYISEGEPFHIHEYDSEIKFTDSLGTCLLTELRWRRGLLLAPMSLHPRSGLVSVPLSPDEVQDFSVVQASPEKVHPRKWSIERDFSASGHGILQKYAVNPATLQA